MRERYGPSAAPGGMALQRERRNGSGARAFGVLLLAVFTALLPKRVDGQSGFFGVDEDFKFPPTVSSKSHVPTSPGFSSPRTMFAPR